MQLRTSIVTASLVAAAVVHATSFELVLDRRAIEEALAIGSSRIQVERVRFHEPYRVPVAKPPVDYIDVITPFRRVVMAAESRVAIGDRLFGQREAYATLADALDEITLAVELSFHPHNTLVGVPEYAVRLTPQGHTTAIPPRGAARVPRFGMRVDSHPLPEGAPATPLPGVSQPLLGGTIVARFDGRLLEPRGVYRVRVLDGDVTLADARVDFGRMR